MTVLCGWHMCLLCPFVCAQALQQELSAETAKRKRHEEKIQAVGDIQATIARSSSDMLTLQSKLESALVRVVVCVLLRFLWPPLWSLNHS